MQEPRSSDTLARSCCAVNTKSVGVCGIEPSFSIVGAFAIIFDIYFFFARFVCGRPARPQSRVAVQATMHLEYDAQR